jgi:predicted aminopeptidase
VWNVFAAPEFSLEPREWCYPVAGCVAYRGWFSEERARASAAELQEKGDDVFIGGVAAYSTLGWFPDPVLSTMLGGQDEDVAGLLIHELAHQRYYASGDTLFNEGFATLVEEEGTRRWLESRRDAAGLCRFHLRQARRAAALGVISALRGELTVIYASALSDDQRRQQRAAAYGNAQEAYARLRAGWSGPPWFDAWFAPGLNNARLAALSSYEDYVPGFRALLAQSDGDLERFYASVEELGRRKPAERDQRLQELSGEPDAAVSAAPPSGTCP